ncbi:hypothetical protein [Pseudonocardia alni]|uniref:hypothetical protein n=1 Tax=Pseudonocardia alni TaxID=33907 RepID=UPI00280BC57C|nr:hypothetical protein [Pseudonocardia alni]
MGQGPIPADLARALAAGGVWQRLGTDPLSGTLLDVGRTRYRPPVAMADHASKDAPGRRVLAGGDGSLTWVAPCGRRATTRPFDHRVFTDPLPDAADHDTAVVAPF